MRAPLILIRRSSSHTTGTMFLINSLKKGLNSDDLCLIIDIDIGLINIAAVHRRTYEI